MQLLLVVPDLHLDRAGLEGLATDSLPRLPALESMLRYGRPGPAGAGWREVLARLAGREDLAAVPPAQVVAAARGLPEPASAWFATPVHQVAGLDHLRLHPAGLLRLDPAARQALVRDFAGAFEGEGLQLHDLGRGLLLTGLGGVDARTRDPAELLGANLRDAPPTGPDAGRLRRLGAELEMWLHGRQAAATPVASGLAPNGIWLWGGGAAPVPVLPSAEPGSDRRLRPLFADDAYAAALWTLGGQGSAPLPSQLSVLLETQEGRQADAELCACVEVAPRRPGDTPMQRLENDWLAPCLAAFRSGRIATVHLHVGGRHWRLTRPFGWQRWRRSRPWWDVLAS